MDVAGATHVFAMAPAISNATRPRARFRSRRGLPTLAFLPHGQRVPTDRYRHLQLGAGPREGGVHYQLGHRKELPRALDLVEKVTELLQVGVQRQLHRDPRESLRLLRRVNALTGDRHAGLPSGLVQHRLKLGGGQRQLFTGQEVLMELREKLLGIGEFLFVPPLALYNQLVSFPRLELLPVLAPDSHLARDGGGDDVVDDEKPDQSGPTRHQEPSLPPRDGHDSSSSSLCSSPCSAPCSSPPSAPLLLASRKALIWKSWVSAPRPATGKVHWTFSKTRHSSRMEIRF